MCNVPSDSASKSCLNSNADTAVSKNVTVGTIIMPMLAEWVVSKSSLLFIPKLKPCNECERQMICWEGNPLWIFAVRGGYFPGRCCVINRRTKKEQLKVSCCPLVNFLRYLLFRFSFAHSAYIYIHVWYVWMWVL